MTRPVYEPLWFAIDPPFQNASASVFIKRHLTNGAYTHVLYSYAYFTVSVRRGLCFGIFMLLIEHKNILNETSCWAVGKVSNILSTLSK